MPLAGLELLEAVTSALVEFGTPHAVIGAAALAAHGIVRSTFDLDLLTVDATVLDPSRFGMLTRKGITVDSRRGEFDDPLKGVVRFHATHQRPVDLVVGRWKWQKEVVERATAMVYGSSMLPTVMMSDLVLLKLDSEGPQDLIDVHNLLQLGGDALRRQIEEKLDGLPATLSKSWSRLNTA